MTQPLNIPFYIKSSVLVIGLYFFIRILYLGQDIILPFIYGLIIAILISPVVGFLVRKKLNRGLAIIMVLVLAVLVSLGIIALIISQAGLFEQARPQLVLRFNTLISQGIASCANFFGTSPQKVGSWILQAENELISKRDMALGVTLTTAGGVLASGILTPVYVLMILYYQVHLIAFTHKLFGAGNDRNVNEVLTETKGIIQSYLTGLSKEFVIITVLNTLGLLILGIEYAFLLGVTGALLNVVPIVGGVICILLFVAVALITKPVIYVLYILLLYSLIQFFDNHYIIPKIVGSKVRLNALVSLMAVILGEALWGIPGMFLSIPLMAIMKVVFDRVDALKPVGFLLGDSEVLSPSLNLSASVQKNPSVNEEKSA